jgi:hypothetical protein
VQPELQEQLVQLDLLDHKVQLETPDQQEILAPKAIPVHQAPTVLLVHKGFKDRKEFQVKMEI